MAEQAAYNRSVGGSNPPPTTKKRRWQPSAERHLRYYNFGMDRDDFAQLEINAKINNHTIAEELRCYVTWGLEDRALDVDTKSLHAITDRYFNKLKQEK